MPRNTAGKQNSERSSRPVKGRSPRSDNRSRPSRESRPDQKFEKPAPKIYKSQRRSKPKAEPVARADGRIRLNRYLAQCGAASRRKADELIAAGKVTVNGLVVRELGSSIDVKSDSVKVKNRAVSPPHRGAVVFYKPRGVVSTLNDPEGRPSISDYLTKHYRSYYPVGRLDYDSSGLMILTNDGDLADRLLHPRYGHERTYLTRVEGSVSQSVLDKLARGVRLQDGIVKAEVRFVAPPADARRAGAKEPESKSTWLEITVLEGRNRLVRRMMEEVRHPVVKLRRISHGPFKLGKLKPGEMRQLTEKEFERIRFAVMEFTGVDRSKPE
jgi:23S rRNA pseudouridine2605 synthase